MMSKSLRLESKANMEYVIQDTLICIAYINKTTNNIAIKVQYPSIYRSRLDEGENDKNNQTLMRRPIMKESELGIRKYL